MTYYDRIAQGYDTLHKEEQLNKIRLIISRSSFPASSLVLDVGCGPGYFAEQVSATVVGLDPSVHLLRKASCIKVCGRAEYLPFKDSQFDYVVSITAVHNFTDIHRAFEEMKRVGTRQWIITLLKKSVQKKLIHDLICSLWAIETNIEERNDTIYFCSIKNHWS